MPLPHKLEHLSGCDKRSHAVYRCTCGADKANIYRDGWAEGWLAATGEFPEGYDDAGN